MRDRGPAGGRPRLHDGVYAGLALAEVAREVRARARDGVGATRRALRQDPAFGLLLGSAAAAFIALAAREHRRLRDKARQASEAALVVHHSRYAGRGPSGRGPRAPPLPGGETT